MAELYGVETKRVNEAVANNPEKFPTGYILEVSETEKQELVENFDRFNRQKHSTSNPKAFTEKGLYMLKRGGQLVDDLLNDVMPVQSSETTLELNLAMLKLKHTVRREKPDNT